MVQYSSLSVSAAVLTLGGDDIVEAGVPDREQVDCEREKGRSERQRFGRQNEDQQRTLNHVTSWMACGWSDCAPETP